MPIDLPGAALGGPIAVSALGPGETASPATREGIVIGRGLRPPGPVALDARRMGDGTIRIGWIRRSRSGWAWLDGAEVPLDEDREFYRLTLAVGETDWIIERSAAGFDYPPGEQPPGLLAGTQPLTVSVVQLGRFGASQPTSQTFSL
ncbi:hypothetical protein HL653_06795 [Sphingomonas sp. AP4-R1]|uniref:hypothetical protein n=1 Tax=Sphingomonas sp. AP4-R1 TaxID=2735134 RepID=UPI001493B42C|nr:hypothetical protein [Sphingomonas sp. AP4-R1]QJU57536.1 hypothetical protein HL653_06795 [Sphingomonas sp. AP4-R1]